MEEQEIWKEIPDYPSYYISSLKRVKHNENILKPIKDKVVLKNELCRGSKSINKLYRNFFIETLIPLKNESWSIIKEYNDYSISNLGRVAFRGRIIKPYYIRDTIYIKINGKNIPVKKLVYNTFIRESGNLPIYLRNKIDKCAESNLYTALDIYTVGYKSSRYEIVGIVNIDKNNIYKSIFRLKCLFCGSIKEYKLMVLIDSESNRDRRRTHRCPSCAQHVKEKKYNIGDIVHGFKLLEAPYLSRKWHVECMKCHQDMYKFKGSVLEAKREYCNDCADNYMYSPKAIHDAKICGRFSNMIRRCYKSNKEEDLRVYRHKEGAYSGDGIKICDYWLENHNNFEVWFTNERSKFTNYLDKLHVDRIDPNGDYAPWNCQLLYAWDNAKKSKQDIIRYPSSGLMYKINKVSYLRKKKNFERSIKHEL